MADRSRDPTIGCFAVSNLSGRPSRQVSTTKRNLVAHLPWAQEAPRFKSGRPDQNILRVFSDLLKACFTQNSSVEFGQTGGLNSQAV